MQQPLIETTCSKGKLIITDTLIKVKFGDISEQTMLRSSLVGIDSKVTFRSLLGKPRAMRLIFRGQGTESIEVGMVPVEAAKQIVALLGF